MHSVTDRQTDDTNMPIAEWLIKLGHRSGQWRDPLTQTKKVTRLTWLSTCHFVQKCRDIIERLSSKVSQMKLSAAGIPMFTNTWRWDFPAIDTGGISNVYKHMTVGFPSDWHRWGNSTVYKHMTTGFPSDWHRSIMGDWCCSSIAAITAGSFTNDPCTWTHCTQIQLNSLLTLTTRKPC